MEPLLDRRSSRSSSVELEHLGLGEDTETDFQVHRQKRSFQDTNINVSTIRSWLCRLGLYLLPSFISTLIDSKSNSADRSLTLRRTSALDGLRGVAALCVVNYHIISAFQNFVNYGYGLTSEEAHREPMCAHHYEPIAHNLRFHQLPIIRLVYSGSGPVCIFFVISGFVLSYKPLQLARNEQWDKLLITLCSSTFRRALRLFLPTTIASFMVMLTIQAGMWEYTRTIANDKTIITAESEHHQERLPTFFAQFLNWLQMLREMTNVWEWEEYYPPYDVHLWTIPMEYRSSMLLFLANLSLSRLQYPFRVATSVILVLYCYSWSRWDTVLFLSGSILAETSLLYDARNTQLSPSSKSPVHLARRIGINFIRCATLFTSLYLLSAPDYCIRRTPGYRLLGKLIPCFDQRCWRFYPSIGAIMVVAVISHTPKSWFVTRYFLDLRVVQYLGWVSYSLYIAHGPLIHIVGYRLFPALWSLTGKESVLGYLIGFLLAETLLLALIFWVADIFCRLVDEKCVACARWLEMKTLRSGSRKG
ncbi:MAG: hypothetical protein M1834_007978 [Cirrosporium novae-zelandiae]|nr:MAG: hypothetical protein M1834_007978 [Cirrosporium novae-zelandiae]